MSRTPAPAAAAAGAPRRAPPRGKAGAVAAAALAAAADPQSGAQTPIGASVAGALREAGADLAAAAAVGGSEGTGAVQVSQERAAASDAIPYDGSGALALNAVRQNLIRQEDSIIFALIERSQYKLDASVYSAGALGEQSLLEFTLREQERMFGKIRRYTDPIERAFFPEGLPPPILPPLHYPEVLHPAGKAINLNAEIMSLYLCSLLPKICEPGDDSNYGSAAMHDVAVLQALSKRIHFGLFVAESKFTAETEVYTELIRNGDAEGIMAKLTNEAVEQRVLQRVEKKAAIYGQDLSAIAEAAAGSEDSHEGPTQSSYKVQPGEIAQLYETWIMPLTKQVQVAYLLRRLDAWDRVDGAAK